MGRCAGPASQPDRPAGAAAGGLFRSWPDPIGQDIDPAAARAYLLEVTGTVTGGQLELAWTYPAGRYDQATITRSPTT